MRGRLSWKSGIGGNLIALPSTWKVQTHFLEEKLTQMDCKQHTHSYTVLGHTGRYPCVDCCIWKVHLLVSTNVVQCCVPPKMTQMPCVTHSYCIVLGHNNVVKKRSWGLNGLCACCVPMQDFEPTNFVEYWHSPSHCRVMQIIILSSWSSLNNMYSSSSSLDPIPDGEGGQGLTWGVQLASLSLHPAELTSSSSSSSFPDYFHHTIQYYCHQFHCLPLVRHWGSQLDLC